MIQKQMQSQMTTFSTTTTLDDIEKVEDKHEVQDLKTLKNEEKALKAELFELQKQYQLEKRKIEAQRLRREFNEKLLQEQDKLIQMKKQLEQIPMQNEYLHQLSHYQRLQVTSYNGQVQIDLRNQMVNRFGERFNRKNGIRFEVTAWKRLMELKPVIEREIELMDNKN